jgi:hypothetical protein
MATQTGKMVDTSAWKNNLRAYEGPSTYFPPDPVIRGSVNRAKDRLKELQDPGYEIDQEELEMLMGFWTYEEMSERQKKLFANLDSQGRSRVKKSYAMRYPALAQYEEMLERDGFTVDGWGQFARANRNVSGAKASHIGTKSDPDRFIRESKREQLGNLPNPSSMEYYSNRGTAHGDILLRQIEEKFAQKKAAKQQPSKSGTLTPKDGVMATNQASNPQYSNPSFYDVMAQDPQRARKEVQRQNQFWNNASAAGLSSQQITRLLKLNDINYDLQGATGSKARSLRNEKAGLIRYLNSAGIAGQRGTQDYSESQWMAAFNRLGGGGGTTSGKKTAMRGGKKAAPLGLQSYSSTARGVSPGIGGGIAQKGVFRSEPGRTITKDYLRHTQHDVDQLLAKAEKQKKTGKKQLGKQEISRLREYGFSETGESLAFQNQGGSAGGELAAAYRSAQGANLDRYDQMLGLYGSQLGALGVPGGGVFGGGGQPQTRSASISQSRQNTGWGPGPGSASARRTTTGATPSRTAAGGTLGGGAFGGGTAAPGGLGGAFGAAEGYYQQMLGLGDTFGRTQKELIDRNLAQRQSRAKQDLISSGLYGSTVSPAISRGLEFDADFQKRAVDEAAQRQRMASLGTMGGFYERTGQAGLGLVSGLAGAMERRTDQYPDLGFYSQLLEKSAAAPRRANAPRGVVRL